MGKKKLDNLFQEKFKDFSEIPDDKVWHAIETSLDQKKKSRKVIPIWWKLGGAAAVLAIALFVINPFEENSKVNPVITDVNDSTEENQIIENSKEDSENRPVQKIQIVDSDEERIVSKEKNVPSKQVTTNTKVTFKNSEADKNNSDKGVFNETNKFDSQITANNVDEDGNEKGVSTKTYSKIEIDLGSQNKETIAGMDKKDIQNQVTEVLHPKENNDGISIKDEKEKNTEVDLLANKKSLFDEIAAQEEEEVVLAQNAGNKWSAGPSVAPVYFNAIGEGSPVHSIFVPNSKSGDVTLSYGLSVAYEISKKLSIRSGVHKVDYGYNTNDVEFSSSVEASANRQINNVDFALTAKNLVVNSKSNTPTENFDPNVLDATSSEVSATSAARDGVMEQQFGYLEVPVELNYALVDNRFGINLIGGVSSLFLVNNSVSLTSGELTTEMGEANNVNAVNFSTNVGFGVNYKFTPKVKLNIEPVFKYQLNTFSTTEGSFQPFSVGVYSGLTFKF